MLHRSFLTGRFAIVLSLAASAGCQRFGLVDSAFSIAVHIDEVAPATGSTLGGERITVTGRNFREGAEVWIDGEAVDTSRVTTTVLTFTTSPHAPGAVPIEVRLPDERAGGCEACFTYAPPTSAITAVRPAAGPTSGGTEVQILGTGFAADARVWFGDAEAEVRARASERLEVVAPPHANGPVAVRVTSDGDHAAEAQLGPAGFRFFLADLSFVDSRHVYDGWVRDLIPMDVDGDGLDDLVIQEQIEGDPVDELRLAVLLSDGAGALEPSIQTHLVMPEGRRLLTREPCDWDGDGAWELLLNLGPEGDESGTSVYISSRQADGAFGAPELLVTDEIGNRITLNYAGRTGMQCGDVDGDGVTDLVLELYPGQFSHHARVYFGDGAGGVQGRTDLGDGFFMDQIMYPRLGVGDLDGDDRDDVVMMSVRRLEGENDTVFSVFTQIDAEQHQLLQHVLDAHYWGPQLAVRHLRTEYVPQSDPYLEENLDLLSFGGGTDALFQGDSAGGFHSVFSVGEPGSTFVETRLSSASSAVPLVNTPDAGPTAIDLFGRTRGDTRNVGLDARFIVSPISTQLARVATLHVDDDPSPDLVFGGIEGVELVLGGVEGPRGGAPWWSSGGLLCHDTLADIDGDGRDDLVGFGWETTTLKVLRSTGRGFELHQEIDVTDGGAAPDSHSVVRRFTMADVDRDGRLDAVVLWIDLSATYLTVLFGQETGRLGSPFVYEGFAPMPLHLEGCWPADEVYQVDEGHPVERRGAACDVDGDGHVDIAHGDLFAPGDGQGRFGEEQRVDVSPVPWPPVEGEYTPPVDAFLYGDVDGDGGCELVEARGDRGAILRYRPDQGLAVVAWFDIPPDEYPNSANTSRVRLVGDVTGDGRADVVVTAGEEGDKELLVYPGQADGGVDAPIVAATHLGPAAWVRLADLDGDGLRDLVVGSDHGYGDTELALVHVVYLGGTTFAQRTRLAINARGGLSFGDLDGDGDADLLSTAPSYESGSDQFTHRVLVNASR